MIHRPVPSFFESVGSILFIGYALGFVSGVVAVLVILAKGLI